jgi:phosphatidylserine/phosphatidylglycerophosphate/cardiolipin synthase-like enzyme
MDMRSFELNEEVVALFFDQRIAARLAAIEERYMQAAPHHARRLALTNLAQNWRRTLRGSSVRCCRPVPGG